MIKDVWPLPQSNYILQKTFQYITNDFFQYKYDPVRLPAAYCIRSKAPVLVYK